MSEVTKEKLGHAWIDDDGTTWVAIDDSPEGEPHVEYKHAGKTFWENDTSLEIGACVTEIIKQQASITTLEAQVAELTGEVERLNKLLVLIEDTCTTHLELPHGMVPDCTDNSGNPYTSQWAADLFKAARAKGGA
jgi:hypothetical protein